MDHFNITVLKLTEYKLIVTRRLSIFFYDVAGHFW